MAMLAFAPPADRGFALPVPSIDIQDDARIDADLATQLWGDVSDRPWLGDDDVPPPEMLGMYYLG